jgi:hypothetical protein
MVKQNLWQRRSFLAFPRVLTGVRVNVEKVLGLLGQNNLALPPIVITAVRSTIAKAEHEADRIEYGVAFLPSRAPMGTRYIERGNKRRLMQLVS